MEHFGISVVDIDRSVCWYQDTFGFKYAELMELLLATHGKVFTTRTLNRLVECTGVKEFKSV